MKNITLILLCFCFFQTSLFAQEVTSVEIAKLTGIINSYQTHSDNKTYTDLRDNNVYTVSFSKDNFNVLFSSKLAYKSVYKQWAGKEVLAVTENIDLTKVTKMEKVVSPGNTSAFTIRMYFGKESLQTTLIENGTVTATIKEDFLEFFYPENTETDGTVLWINLHKLVALLKQVKGGNASAEYIELGRTAVFDEGDKEKAKGYFQKAIDAGNIHAVYMMSHANTGSNAWLTWVKQAADKGHVEAMGVYALQRYTNDNAYGRQLLLAAAEKGSVTAMTFLGVDENTRGNDEGSTRWYEKAYELRESVVVKYNIYDNLIKRYIFTDKIDKLGEIVDNPDIYSSGLEKEIIEIFKAVAVAGSGNGKEAVAKLLEIATTTRNKKVKETAFDQLGWIYQIGIGVKKNKKLQAEYSQKSSDARNE